MKIDDLSRLADRAEGVEGRAADRLAEIHGKIAVARRRRVGVAVASGGVVAAAVAGGTAITTMDRSQGPTGEPTPPPSKTVQIPEGQRTVVAEFGPQDIGGWELVASRTNAQAGYEGATELTLIGDQMPWDGTSFCQGDSDIWWVFLTVLDGGDGAPRPGDGAITDGSRGAFGRCSPEDPTAPPAPHDEIDPSERYDPAAAYELRMFVTGPLGEEAQRCLGTEHAASCPGTHGIEPLAQTDAIFGFGDFQEKRAPYVLELPGLAPLRALTIAEDGVEYLVDRAVIGADDSDQLVVRLPAFGGRRLVEVGSMETPEMRRCIDDAHNAANFTEAIEECATELRLRLDGVRLAPSDTYKAGQWPVPGGEHIVTVDVVKGDPRLVRPVLIIWEERP